ncbi:Dihydrosphingosine phosphate lyase [Orobanche hederae]
MELEEILSYLNRLRASANSYLSQFEPVMLVLIPTFTLLFAKIVQSIFRIVFEKGLKHAILEFIVTSVKLVPGVQKYIDAEKQKVVDKLQGSGKSKRDGWRTELPMAGLGVEVISKMKDDKQKDVAWQGKCSGIVYIAGNEEEGHFSLINKACSMFAHTNPLHLDVFPSVVRFEAEVVMMTAALLGSKEKASGGQICGNMTSGGTESILLAVKTSRDYMKVKKGINSPEMIIPISAHSAYDKAAQYFKIKLWRVCVGQDFRADVKAIERHINRNTILIVGSAPGFPHGILDPIEELGELASTYKICLHVDLCLGGFVLPFARMLGYPVPPFDFSSKGVTSISVDVHKYGLAPKGTSVVLYRDHDIRKVTEWSGGLYISPSIAGSRPGGLIAGAWAAMMSLGLEGLSGEHKEDYGSFKENRERVDVINNSLIYRSSIWVLYNIVTAFICRVRQIPELFVIGRPDMTIVAFGSDILDIFEVNDIMSSKGWRLNALQRPNSIHICITLQHVNVIEDFLKDLRDSVQTVKANPGPINGGLAPIYGAAGKMPDRATVQDLLVDFMDTSC